MPARRPREQGHGGQRLAGRCCFAWGTSPLDLDEIVLCRAWGKRCAPSCAVSVRRPRCIEAVGLVRLPAQAAPCVPGCTLAVLAIGAHQQRSRCRRCAAQHQIGAQVLDAAHHRVEARRGSASAPLGSHAQHRRRRKRPGGCGRCRRCHTAGVERQGRFMGGVPMKRAAKVVAGRGVQRARRAGLLDPALVQQHHLVGHAHGFGLVVRHVHHGQAQRLLQLAQIRAAFPGAAGRPGWTAARPSGTPWPAPPDGAPSATRCCWPPDSWPGLRSSRCESPSRSAASLEPRPLLGWPAPCASPSGRSRCCRPRTGAGRARSSGTPWRCRAAPAAGR
jgi:hypothetical protein